jgi:hypothetical protein
MKNKCQMDESHFGFKSDGRIINEIGATQTVM